MNARKRKSVNLRRLRAQAEENPESSPAQMRLGTALLHLGLLDEAEVRLRKALDLDDGCIEAWINLGGIRLSRWDFEGCIEANERAIEKDPECKPAYINKGLGHLYRNEAVEMLKSFKKVIQLDPESPSGHYYTAVGLNAVKERTPARYHLRKAVELGYSPDPSFLKEMERDDEECSDGLTILEFGPEESNSHSRDRG